MSLRAGTSFNSRKRWYRTEALHFKGIFVLRAFHERQQFLSVLTCVPQIIIHLHHMHFTILLIQPGTDFVSHADFILSGIFYKMPCISVGLVESDLFWSVCAFACAWVWVGV